ncbi:formamidopyrimidine-DNA glycosylase [Synechococcus sp. PCC 7335]|uniref:DNA-formamidopyrimidine glycosylase n=1 Tax=Synechococcus sp. (strain ATCC 29403 / PCC 7335) TaxID=91464 RepID=UPI00017EB18B|nr:DNA-formamidopyrimidine glycosylase [Synechococcus sp. PCC 7335]EDX85466.1 formamidopyrimidine-DNA glycosylase [Synechococcus sp. PCC 7335]
MPELPEVETVRRGLNRVSLNQPVRGGEVRLARTIAYPELADAFLEAMSSVQITSWHRRGKYLLATLCQRRRLELEPAGWLGVHLRMTGQLLWVPKNEPMQTHCRVRLFFDGDNELRYVDQRTFGRLWWVPPDRAIDSVMTGLQKLGPEPFSEEFSIDYLASALKGRQRPIKNALLDQRLVAGIGNIYADEALFLSGIRPTVVCDRLTRRKITKLHQAIRDVLTTSIESGGTTFSDFRDVHGTNGNYGGVAWVYDREGEPCRKCGVGILRIKLAGRSAHYCPKCQR